VGNYTCYVLEGFEPWINELRSQGKLTKGTKTITITINVGYGKSE
jgi:hypothetical protein